VSCSFDLPQTQQIRHGNYGNLLLLPNFGVHSSLVGFKFNTFFTIRKAVKRTISRSKYYYLTSSTLCFVLSTISRRDLSKNCCSLEPSAAVAATSTNRRARARSCLHLQLGCAFSATKNCNSPISGFGGQQIKQLSARVGYFRC
jgi:hypothetical protein